MFESILTTYNFHCHSLVGDIAFTYLSKSLNMEFFYSYTVLLPFYFCKMVFSLPLKIKKLPNRKCKSGHIFQISMLSAVGIIALMYCNLNYLNTVFNLSTSCKTNNNCSSVFLGIIESSYCFGLLAVNLFINPVESVELFNRFNEIVNVPNHVSDKFKVEVFQKIFIFYMLILFQFLRNCFFDNNKESIIWILKIIMQNVQFAVDGIIVSFCLILGSSFKGIVYDLNSDDKNVRRNIATFWDCRALLRKLNDCYGPALVIVVVFKLLQISGLIYFYLFSDLKNNWLQFLDICLPLINFILICYSCDRAVIEAQNFVKELRLKHAEENSSSAIKEEIQDFIYVNKFTTLCITGCNFFVVDMNLLFKISSVIFTYIVAIVQF